MMKSIPTLLFLLSTGAALAPNHKVRPQQTPFTGRGQVSLKYQDSVQDRVHICDSALRDATKSLKIRDFPLIADSQEPQPQQSKPRDVLSVETKLKTVAPPSDRTLKTLGCALAANAGFLNGLALTGLLGPGVGVAAVTGAWTNSALRLASGNLSAFALQFSMIVAYFSGSLVNGVMYPEGIQWNQSSCPSRTLLLVAAMVVAASSLSSLPLLGAAVGLQNSWTSMLVAGNLYRTGHFSGVTSDVGTKVGQWIRSGSISAEQKEKITTQFHVVCSFFMGGILSVLCNHVFGKTKVGMAMSATLLATSYVALRLRNLNLKETVRSKVASRFSLIPVPL